MIATRPSTPPTDGSWSPSATTESPASPTRDDWVAWVGTWDDIVSGGEGQYRVRLMDNTKGADTAYPGLELLPDGTFVATTYGHWTEGEEPYIVSVRFTMEELDRRAKFAGKGVTGLVAKTPQPIAPGHGPNVLFIAVDDLNDWALGPDSPLHMPNFQPPRSAWNAVQPRLHGLAGLQPIARGADAGPRRGHDRDLRQPLGLAGRLPRRRDATPAFHAQRLPGRRRGKDLPPSRQQRLP